ncbi:unnamed protein product [Tetraodon nigroviridis]|uniref:Chromosome 2 SCAF14990, whole genome shotgun sequence n=1 Tax=Tetraodon nigroviridis TaxID=99883 RepID=Q4RWD4_TETNG|nr:unnamed protein product [Tetraodon nigroviridis]
MELGPKLYCTSHSISSPDGMVLQPTLWGALLTHQHVPANAHKVE